jgi:hypothetical protein
MSAVCRQEEAVAMGRVFAIGASNAGNTATALEREGIRCVPVTLPGCTVTRESVDGVLRRLMEEHKDGDIMLIQWLENSIFFLLNGETGSMELPKRDEQDGIFHVTGKVVVSKDMQLEALLEKLEPLLEWNLDTLKLLLCPLVRFLEEKILLLPQATGDPAQPHPAPSSASHMASLRPSSTACMRCPTFLTLTSLRCDHDKLEGQRPHHVTNLGNIKKAVSAAHIWTTPGLGSGRQQGGGRRRMERWPNLT